MYDPFFVLLFVFSIQGILKNNEQIYILEKFNEVAQSTKLQLFSRFRKGCVCKLMKLSVKNVIGYLIFRRDVNMKNLF